MVSFCSIVTRLAHIVLIAAVASARLVAQSSTPRSFSPGAFSPGAFSKVPFDQWLGEPDQKGIRWTIHVAEPELSNHQRLASRLEINVDGAELARRRGEGSFVLLMQISDEQNHNWRDFESVDLSTLPAAIKNSEAVYYRNFFVLPGDYQVLVAAYFTNGAFNDGAAAPSEHFLTRRKLHVAALHNDPLPGAWDGLPAVEFVRLPGGPENWYLPFVRSRVKVAAAPKRPARIDVLLNLSPADSQAGSARVRNRNLSALLPSFKVLAQMEHDNTALNAAVLNLSRQQVVFKQDSVRRLDWRRLMASINEDKPGIIDVKSLENRHSSPQFFADEVMRRLSPATVVTGEAGAVAEPPRAVIILSSPVTFEEGADLRPVEAAASPDAKLFYLRYQPVPTTQLTSGRRPGPRRGSDGFFVPSRAGSGPVWDQLASVLKPADPKLFDVTTPEQFRKALAAVLAEIAKM
jgi:hypothetical protein